MSEENQEPKSPLPNYYLWILIGALFLMMFVQSIFHSPVANVGFSYELEHLVNLQLVQPEESRKTAMGNNLVTFSGKFREEATEEGKTRYHFLEMLDRYGELKHELQDIRAEIGQENKEATEAALLYINLASIPVPQEGFEVLDYKTVSNNFNLTIKDTPKPYFPNMKEVGALLEKASSDPALLPSSENGLNELVASFRSPQLGIGNNTLKEQLKTLQALLVSKDNEPIPLKTQKEVYSGLESIAKQLDAKTPYGTLQSLRSIRSIKTLLNKEDTVEAELEITQSRLNRARDEVSSVIWFFNNQELSTKALEKQDWETFHPWFTNASEEWHSFNENRGASFRAPDQPVNLVLEKTFKSEEPQPNYFGYFLTFLPIILLGVFLYIVFAKQMKGVGNSAMNFGKSPARMLDKSNNKITFKDVAGIEEEKEELQEIVDFLKNPQKFTALGGKIPKGVLCIGPPGTGKTLIAKAVAGEADRPFFSISGSDFVEMFVGVGASRIRDLFNQAKSNAPCIVFIDEIDAVGRHRGAGIGGGHDEREQTLNQLLVEMDGFNTNEGVILMAATNRPDVLDKALLRPGRFDRRVVISLPDIKGRYDILKVHAEKIKMDSDVDLMAIAKSTPGSSGADLANLLNEAALAAARKNRSAVTMVEVNEARDKVLYGKERRSLELGEEEKRTTAYHEAGHTLVGMLVKHRDPIDKVTIIPRGFSLGATMFMPEKNKVNYWREELYDRLAVMMGGRAAEEIFVHDVSSGAQQDIRQATQLARSMVCEWGMSDKLGTIAYDERQDGGQYLGVSSYHDKKYSEETARSIDTEVRTLVDTAYQLALSLISEHRSEVELMTQMLMEFETLDSEDVQKIINGTWDIEEKRAKLKRQEELHKKAQTPPPPPPLEENVIAPETPSLEEAEST